MNATGALCTRVRRNGLLTPWDGAPGLGALLVTGPDAEPFLQSRLTCDVAGLAPGAGAMGAALQANGSLVALLHLLRLPERGQPFPSYLVVTDRDVAADLGGHLRRFLITEVVTIADASSFFSGHIVQAPPAVLEAFAPDPGEGFISVPLSLTGDPGLLVLQDPAADHNRVREAARRAGLVELPDDQTGRQAWDWLRIEGGWLRPGPDYTPDKTLLSALGLEEKAVSWTKGCYPGQEVVARIRTYGSVPKRMTGLVLREPLGLGTDEVPPPGTGITTTSGKTIGRWASAGWSCAWERPVALALLDRDHRAPGQILTLAVGDVDLEAEVVDLPLYAGAESGDRAHRSYLRAVRLFTNGDDERAAALLQEAVTLDPGHAEAWEALGVVLGRTGRFHEAIDVLRRLEERLPGEPMINTNLSLYHMKIGDREEAERQKALATLKKFGGPDTGLDAAAREEALTRDRRAEAERRKSMFAEVLALDPGDGLALMGMGQALLDLDDPAGAEDFLSRAREALKDNSALIADHARALEALGRRDDAAAAYREGIRVASRRGDLMPLQKMQHRLLMLEGVAG